MTMPTPIALFVYNRPMHTRQTVEALKKNELSISSDLYIFSDAAKSEIQVEAVREVRYYIRKIDGFNSVTIVERESNFGLASSIIDGVTSVVNKYGRIIVIEDDLITSPYFLEYMNRALEKFSNDEQVMQISGYMFPGETKTVEDSFFLPITTSWGWGTWQRAWKHFDPDARGYEELKKYRSRRQAFDLDGSYPYFKMLELQLHGKVDSWAIRWWLSVFLRNGLVLYPRHSLVDNIGFDGSGTHGDKQGVLLNRDMRAEKIKFPTSIKVSYLNYEAVIRIMRKLNDRGILKWIRRIF